MANNTAQSNQVMYAIIVSDNASDPDPLWTFVSLYRNVESAMQGMKTQYYLEHQHAEKISLSASGRTIFAEGARGHQIEFRMVALKAPAGYCMNTTKKLYAVSVDNHIDITGESFYTCLDSLKKYDVCWQEAVKEVRRSHGKYDEDQMGVYTTRANNFKRYKIMEFQLKG